MKKTSLKSVAERVRRAGEGHDYILAHIHPYEAKELERKYGGNINPQTGLPQYGKFFKEVGRVLKKAAPVIGGVLGTMVGGPAGGIAGGALAGGLSSKKHRGQHALWGGLTGGFTSLMMPAISGMLGAGGAGMGAFGGSGALESLGPLMTAKGFLGGRGGHPEREQQNESLEQKAQDPDLLSRLFHPDNVDMGLRTTAAIGTLLRRQKQPHEQSMQEYMAAHQPQARAEDRVRNFRYNRNYLQPQAHGAGHQGGLDARYQFLDNPSGALEYYARGGYVRGNSGGQDDDVYTEIPDGSFIQDATTVSALGDGNSENGARQLERFEEMLLNGPSPLAHMRNVRKKKGGIVKAQLSPGEYEMSPEAVTALGKGSNKKGVQKLEKLRRSIRKHKGIKKFLPPKSKSIDSYMRGT